LRLFKRGLTREEKLSKIIDSLIVLFCLNDGNMDYLIVNEALTEIARTRKKNGHYPITVSLAIYMREKGFDI